MDNLNETLYRVVEGYAGEGLNSMGYLTQSRDGSVLAVVDVAQSGGKRVSNTMLIARLVGDHIVIEKDANSDPLYEALMQAGIPREQIILAYAGEPVPETA
jgi:hypothetical protein